MNEQLFKHRDLNAYLLGTLPTAETARFDELSFTDERFSDALKQAENDLVDAYVRGELTGATLKNFNSHYLATPRRREKVEFAKNFQIFAEKNFAAETIETAESGETNKNGFFARIFDNLRLWQFGFAAAALLLLIFGGWFFVQNSRLQNQFSESLARQTEFEQREKQLRDQIASDSNSDAAKENELTKMREELAQLEKQREQQKLELEKQKETLAKQRQPPTSKQNSAPPLSAGTIAFFALAPQLRSGNLPTISIPADAKSVAMRLELEPNDYAVFRVALKKSAGKMLWQSSRIKAKQTAENKSLNINFPARLLQKQTYTLEVSGISADGKAEIINDYSFRNMR